MKKRRVFGIGEIVLDVIFRQGQPQASMAGGSVLNALVSLSRGDESVFIVSETGQDHVGEMILSFLDDNGISTEYVYRFEKGQTPVAFAFLNDQMNASYEFYKQYPSVRRLIIPKTFSSDDVLLFGSFYGIAPEVREDVRKAVSEAKKNNALIIYDPNIRSQHKLDENCRNFIIENMIMANIIRASDEDLNYIFGVDNPENAYNIVKEYCDILVVTQNSKDVILFTHDLCISYPVPRIKPVSTIGAGDNFNAGMVKAIITNNIKSNDLNVNGRVTEDSWNKIIMEGISYSSKVCLSYENYIPK